MIFLVASSSLSLAAGGVPKPDDWIQFVIFAVVIIGSIISGLINAAKKKAESNDRREVLRRHIDSSNRDADDEEASLPQSEYQRPVARPMPSPAPPVVSPMRPAAQSAADLVKMLRERIEAQARQQAEARKAKPMTMKPRRDTIREIRQPAPLKQRPPASRTPAVTRAPRAPVSNPAAPPHPSVAQLAGSDEIADREHAWDAAVDRRIGSVGAHIGASGGNAIAVAFAGGLGIDKDSLRRAILMNEILGPPIALRDPLLHDDKWDAV